MGKSSKLDIDDYNSPLAKNLRDLMDGKHSREKISQNELAEKIGTTRQAISQYRNGTVAPNTEKLCQIADHFKVSTDFLLGRTGVIDGDADNMAIEKRFGLSPKAIESLEELRQRSNGEKFTMNPYVHQQRINAINLLLENELSGCNIFEFIASYLWHDYEALPLLEDIGYHRTDNENPSKTLKVLEKNSGTNYVFSVNILSQAAILHIQEMLISLKNKGGDVNG